MIKVNSCLVILLMTVLSCSSIGHSKSCSLNQAQIKKLETRAKYVIKSAVDFQTASDTISQVELLGTVTDRRTGNPIPALVNVVGEKTSVTADDQGNFSLKIPKGGFKLEIIYPGYTNFVTQDLFAKGHSKVTICLGTTIVK